MIPLTKTSTEGTLLDTTCPWQKAREQGVELVVKEAFLSCLQGEVPLCDEAMKMITSILD